MFDRRFFAEAAAIVAAALLCATIANLVAAKERKLQFVGNYPNALKVPPKPVDPLPATTDPSAEPAPSPVEPAVAPVTATPAMAAPAAAPAPAPAVGKPASAAGGTPASTAAVAPTKPAAAAMNFPPHPDRPWVEVNYPEVRELFRRKALFLDARRSSVFAEGHIAGARSFAVWESDVDDKVRGLLDEGMDPSAPIVVYCTGGNCEDSHMLSDKLYRVGFDNALVYKDGYPDWQKRGEPVATGGGQ